MKPPKSAGTSTTSEGPTPRNIKAYRLSTVNQLNLAHNTTFVDVSGGMFGLCAVFNRADCSVVAKDPSLSADDIERARCVHVKAGGIEVTL
jgi:hypothetical protein